MNLRQAYDGWSQQEQNRTLYTNTRDAFRRAWFTLPTNKPCSWYTKDVLALALAETRVVESDKVKSASVMVHVLNWAHFAEPKWNPKPDFTMNDVTRLIRLPADELEKERQRITAAMQSMLEPKEHDEEQNDIDIDPVTALPRQAMATEASEQPATDDESKDPLEGINFPDGNEVVEPQDNESMEQQKRPRGKAPKPVAQIDPDTFGVVKVWPSLGAAESELGAYNIHRSIAQLRKSAGFYWSDPKDADTFADRLKQKQDTQPKAKQQPKPKAEKTTIKPSPAVQVAVADNPTPSVTQQSAADAQPAPAEQPVNYTLTPEPLSRYSDEDLLAELDRRGFEGELSRRVVYTIGAQ